MAVVGCARSAALVWQQASEARQATSTAAAQLLHSGSDGGRRQAAGTAAAVAARRAAATCHGAVVYGIGIPSYDCSERRLATSAL